MDPIVSTIYSTAQHVSKEFAIPYVYQKNTTLNEALNINPDNIFSVTNPVPRVAYMAIGNGGHKMIAGANNQYSPQPVQHLATDAALYNQIPWVLVPVANDLSLAEQANYAMKTILSIGGSSYAAYFLKRLDVSSLNFTSVLSQVQNGVTTTAPFTPSAANIAPTPPALGINSSTTASSQYIKSNIKVPLTISAQDVANIQNACDLYPNAVNPALKNVPIISEIALCSGIDDTTVNDAIGVQVNVFITALVVLKYNLNGWGYSFDYGSSQPLFNIVNG